MKTSRKLAVVLICVGFFPMMVPAEFRLWTDTKNKVIEAEFVRMSFDAVVLRTANGKELKVSLDSLSEKDREYAMLQCPPKIKITVKDHEDSEIVGGGGGGRRGGGGVVSRISAITADVELIKANKERYGLELKMDLVFIGKTGALDRYTIVGRFSSAFSFTDENKGQYFKSFGPVDIESSSGPSGSRTEYENYLLVVRDRTDQIIAVKAGRAEFEKNAAVLADAESGATYDREFRLISDADSDAE